MSGVHADETKPVTVAADDQQDSQDNQDNSDTNSGASTDDSDAFSQGSSTKEESGSTSASTAAPVEIKDFDSAVKALNTDDADQKIKAVQFLGAAGDARAIPVLQALTNDGLFVGKDGALVYLDGNILRDALTGKEVPGLKSDGLPEVSANNRMRGLIQGVIGQLGLFAPDPSARRRAVTAISSQPTPVGEAMLRQALAKEADPDTKAAMLDALARFDLADADPAKRLAAVEALADSNDPNVKGMLDPARQIRTGPQSARRRRQGGDLDRLPAWGHRHRRQPVRRAFARQHPAARRDRPRHHLRRDGRHQHGAWRDDHARRLHHLRRAAGVPRLPAAAAGSTPICWWRCRLPFWSRRWSASRSSAA